MKKVKETSSFQEFQTNFRDQCKLKKPDPGACFHFEENTIFIKKQALFDNCELMQSS